MFDDFEKCRFCRNGNGTDIDSCTEPYCYEYRDWLPDKHKLIEGAKEMGITVTDLVTLIKMP